MSIPRDHRCPPSGLTLLELMVVLVILAIVATVAIESLQPQVDNQRFQTASRLLSAIQDATVGPQKRFQVDDTPLISGFIADIGRLPRPASSSLDSSQSDMMDELWDVESQLATQFPFQFRSGPNQPIDYSEVRLPCGWRGPYMQLPLGSRSIRDPWGRPPELISDANGHIQSVQITIPINGEQTDPIVLSADLTTGRVSVSGKILVDNPDDTAVRVAMLIPDPDTSLTSLAVLDDEDKQADSFLFHDVPVGLRAIAVESAGKITIKYVQVPHGGVNVVIDLQTRNSNSIN